jgi:hypothetical protein
MITTLPNESWVSYRWRGTVEYAQIVMNATCVQVGPIPPEGTLVQPCVWKGDALEPRGKPKKYSVAS